MSKTILGIDPGSRVMGYAVLSEDRGKLIALRCDVIRLVHIENHLDRLNVIFDKVTALLKSINPSSCAIETPIYGADPQAMLKLGRAQAAAILAMKQQGRVVHEYYPKEVKKAITGNGNANKEQVAFMLGKMIQLPDERLSKDATDALAVAWCHNMNIKGTKTRKQVHQNNKKGDWTAFVADHPNRVKS